MIRFLYFFHWCPFSVLEFHPGSVVAFSCHLSFISNLWHFLIFTCRSWSWHFCRALVMYLVTLKSCFSEDFCEELRGDASSTYHISRWNMALKILTTHIFHIFFINWRRRKVYLKFKNTYSLIPFFFGWIQVVMIFSKFSINL